MPCTCVHWSIHLLIVSYIRLHASGLGGEKRHNKAAIFQIRYSIMSKFSSHTADSLWPGSVGVDSRDANLRKIFGAICPGLNVGNARKPALSGLPQELIPSLKGRLSRDGYFQVDPRGLDFTQAAKKLAQGIRSLKKLGWPATFVLMFDEAWELIYSLNSFMKSTTGCSCCYDILAWYVDPSESEAGFSPHRDRQPDDVASSFRSDGSPRYATCWTALTEASHENSCLYVLPAWADPGYLEGDCDDIDPLQRALDTKEKYQSIRCLPTQPGSSCVFTHRIIHWGSRGREDYNKPRLALATACSDPSFEQYYLKSGGNRIVA